jgi:hypothetical protein
MKNINSKIPDDDLDLSLWSGMTLLSESYWNYITLFYFYFQMGEKTLISSTYLPQIAHNCPLLSRILFNSTLYKRIADGEFQIQFEPKPLYDSDANSEGEDGGYFY